MSKEKEKKKNNNNVVREGETVSRSEKR